ncbi:MAG: hydrogenase [Deltaproteobacteria bacterium]|nr:hydrogenase [Deltaproteobacteria bacterium]
MLDLLVTRLRQGRRTLKYPAAPAPPLPERFRGAPRLAPCPSSDDCGGCAAACPTGALALESGPRIDLGRCLFCGECETACAGRAIEFTREHRLAARTRADLLSDGGPTKLAEAVEARTRALFGRSLRLRQVSAGGCNACEADANVLGTVVWDMGRFGIQFVASPRHADGLLVTGPVTENMKAALLKTYEAVPDPKLVIASGACAIAGGPYAAGPETNAGIGDLLPVDLYVPGCPPHPLTLLDGLLRLLGMKLSR